MNNIDAQFVQWINGVHAMLDAQNPTPLRMVKDDGKRPRIRDLDDEFEDEMKRQRLIGRHERYSRAREALVRMFEE